MEENIPFYIYTGVFWLWSFYIGRSICRGEPYSKEIWVLLGVMLILTALPVSRIDLQNLSEFILYFISVPVMGILSGYIYEKGEKER